MRNKSSTSASQHPIDGLPVVCWETDLHHRLVWCSDEGLHDRSGWQEGIPGQTLAEWLGDRAWENMLAVAWESARNRGPIPLRFQAHGHKFQGWARPRRSRLGRLQGVHAAATLVPWIPLFDSDSDIDATSFDPSHPPVVWHQVAQATADYVVVLDEHSVIHTMNHHRTGDLTEKYAGKTVLELIAPECRQAVRKAIRRVRKTGVTEVIQFTSTDRNDKQIWFDGRLSCLVDQEGTELLVLAATDITRRKEMEFQLTREERALRQLLEIQDRERRLVAYEIHDGLVQDTVGTQMLLESALHDAALPKKIRAALETARESLAAVLREGRRLISDLRPMVIDETGLIESIEYLTHEFATRDPHVAVELECRVQFERLEPILEGTLFRVVKEAVLNAVTHGNATRIQIRLVQIGSRNLILEIRDNGIGFVPEEIQPRRFGLEGIRERARAFQGGFSLETAPGQGTRVTVKIPLSSERGVRTLY